MQLPQTAFGHISATQKVFKVTAGFEGLCSLNILLGNKQLGGSGHEGKTLSFISGMSMSNSFGPAAYTTVAGSVCGLDQDHALEPVHRASPAGLQIQCMPHDGLMCCVQSVSQKWTSMCCIWRVGLDWLHALHAAQGLGTGCVLHVAPPWTSPAHWLLYSPVLTRANARGQSSASTSCSVHSGLTSCTTCSAVALEQPECQMALHAIWVWDTGQIIGLHRLGPACGPYVWCCCFI